MRCARRLCANVAEFIIEAPQDNLCLVACLTCTKETVLRDKYGSVTYRPIRKGLKDAKNRNKR